MRFACRSLRLLLLALLSTLATVPTAAATHYEYALLSWERVLPGDTFDATIRLTYEIAYRYPSPLHFQTPLAVGDAFPDSSEPWFRIEYRWGDTPDQVRGNLTVKRISPAANLIIGEGCSY